MKKLFIYRGCPCSGKSTAAQEYKNNVDSEVVIANRDSIRYEIGNGKYDQQHESEVTRIETEMVENGMQKSKTIILDDTNLNPKYMQSWYDLAEKYGYEVEIRDFYIPFKEAMERSKARRDAGGLYIPKDVMLGFYKRYYKDKFEEEMRDYRILNTKKWDNNLPNCIICDLDGTLVMHNGRMPFEWKRINEDKIDERLSYILNSLSLFKDKCKIIFLTGRPDSVKEDTEAWLNEHYKGEYILMTRDVKDSSHGYEYKKALYEKEILNKYNVLCVFEDSNKCVEMWREQGLLTFQVQNGDY